MKDNFDEPKFDAKMCEFDSSKTELDREREQMRSVNIPTPLFLILMKTSLKGSQMQMLLWILQTTLGNNRRTIMFDIKEWAGLLDLHETTISQGLNKLEEMFIIKRARGGGNIQKRGMLYLNDWHAWNAGHNKELITKYEEIVTSRK